VGRVFLSWVLIRAGIMVSGIIARPCALPPGAPAGHARTLRAAYLETLRDPEFPIDGGRSRLDVNPMAGEPFEQVVSALFSLNATVVARLRELLR